MVQGVELPVLIARVADEPAIERLRTVAEAGRVLYVHLVSPPASTSPHLLEVYAPSRTAPLCLLAQPLGPPLPDQGHPLRLSVPDSAPVSNSNATMQAPSLEAAIASPTPARVVLTPAPSSDPFIGRSLAGGKLLIETCVGQGGAGTVYRARHRDLEMSVAVKVMHMEYQRDADFCRRFHAEALSASRLDHAHLTRVLDFGQEPDGRLYIAMEYLDGKSLRQVLDEEKKLSFERVAQIMIQVCSGLTHAHARSIVHRDIKPENLVVIRGLDEDGRETDIVKVCDFGIAHRSASDSPAIFAGTAEYISPEQFAGDEPDVQSDVYACGVVLYELLTGTVPIAGDIPAIIPRVMKETPEPPSRHVPSLDARIDRLVLKALAKDREIRHASVRELRTELKETAEEISLFSSGGYWNDVNGAVGGPTSSAPAPSTDGAPEWLERGTGYMGSIPPQPVGPPSSRRATPAEVAPAVRHSTLPSLSPKARSPSMVDITPDVATGNTSIMPGSHISMTPAAISETDEVARAVASFLKKLLATTEADKFAALVAPLPPKIRTLVDQGQIAAAWKLHSALGMIATEPTKAGSRAPFAQAALAVFSERAVLVSLAEYALDALKDRDGFSRKLVSRAGNAGAHAAYTARTKHSVFEARERFVALLREIGAEALPTIRVALERLESRLAVPGALWIAEDLLKSIPDVRDEELAQCVARYAKAQAPTLALLATTALFRLWGKRARAILISQLHHKEDDVAVAAMKCLRRGGIDAEILKHLQPVVLGAARARASLRLAAVEALADATPEALPLAKALLAETLAASQGITPDVEDMVVTISSVLIAINGDSTLVAERWRKSNGFLRTRLETLLRQTR